MCNIERLQRADHNWFSIMQWSTFDIKLKNLALIYIAQKQFATLLYSSQAVFTTIFFFDVGQQAKTSAIYQEVR